MLYPVKNNMLEIGAMYEKWALAFNAYMGGSDFRAATKARMAGMPVTEWSSILPSRHIGQPLHQGRKLIAWLSIAARMRELARLVARGRGLSQQGALREILHAKSCEIFLMKYTL